MSLLRRRFNCAARPLPPVLAGFADARSVSDDQAVRQRLKCLTQQCGRRTFAGCASNEIVQNARRTSRVAKIVRLLGHSTGGRPAERLLGCFGMMVSDDTVLRCLKNRSATPSATALRVVGIDDWSWRRGQTYGTIIVDLERRCVVDVLADRSSTSVAAWLSAHPSIEIVSRDRQGLYAEGARIGAPQARQIADRFHLIQNLREVIEKQLGRLERPLRTKVSATAEIDDTRAGLRCLLQAKFEQVRRLYDAGKTATAITQELGLSRKRVDKWIRLNILPERNAMAPTRRSPAYYEGYLSRRSAERCTVVRRLLTEIKQLRFTGCYTHLARFVSPWRRRDRESKEVRATSTPSGLLAQDPVTGRQISPQMAAMRGFAMRFRGILRSRDGGKLDAWLEEACHSGIYALQRFARTAQGDLDAVRNAVTERWSNGQAEGQISRLKTLKRAMYDRAGVALLRARMLPFQPPGFHTN
ncbi:ISL3 family transposase [Acidiphilium sp. PA]|uniref:ISL3 family transposase n=1 Tax=Acidiphilium sp. PA TaxID=2871705 RepID=UPI0038D1192A